MDWEQKKTEDGKLYYFNTQNNETSWVKPGSLSDPAVNPTDWEEQTTQTGKTYYLNKRTSEITWEPPEEFLHWKNSLAAFTLQASVLDNHSDIEECEEGQISDDAPDPVHRREGLKQVYTELFEEAGVTSTWKWEDFHRIMRDDDRYNTLKTIGQKKQIFQEYVLLFKKKEREDNRLKKQVARENFLKMLDSAGILRTESKFHKTAHFFQGDPRWRILEDKERTELFQDFLDELERRDREKLRLHRKTLMQQLRKTIKDREGLSHLTKWAHFQDAMSEDPDFTALDQLDQLTVLSEFVVETESRVSAAKRHEEATAARRNRENFMKLLEECRDRGVLGPATHWQGLLDHIKNDHRYLALVGQPGSSPRDLFNEAVEKERMNLKDSVDSLRDALLDVSWGPGASYQALQVRIDEALDPMDLSEKQLVFQVLYEENMELLQEAQRKHRKCMSKFEEFLRNHDRVAPGCVIEDIWNDIEDNHTQFKKLKLEELVAAFDLFMDILNEESASELEPGEIKHKPRKREHKKAKKHKRTEPYKKNKKKHKHRPQSERETEFL